MRRQVLAGNEKKIIGKKVSIFLFHSSFVATSEENDDEASFRASECTYICPALAVAVAVAVASAGVVEAPSAKNC